MKRYTPSESVFVLRSIIEGDLIKRVTSTPAVATPGSSRTTPLISPLVGGTRNGPVPSIGSQVPLIFIFDSRLMVLPPITSTDVSFHVTNGAGGTSSTS